MKTERVLIVDDDETFIRLVDRVLSHEGYVILKATNGQEALRQLFTRKPDLVLLDVEMPKMGLRRAHYHPHRQA